MSQPKLDEDGAIRLDEPFGTAFDDVLDELHDNPSLAGGVEFTETEKEALRAEDERFRYQLLQECNNRLRTQGIAVTRIGKDLEGSYLLKATDAQGRLYEATLTLAEGERMQDIHAENAGREIVALLCRTLLAERERWFRRMQ